MSHPHLPERVADVEQPRVAEHGHEGIALAPGELELGEIDLRLVPRRGLEADDGLGRRSRADTADEVSDLAVTARVAGGPDLVEEADGGELGVVGQPGLDDLFVGVERGGPRRAWRVARRCVEVSVELAVGDPAADGALVDAESSSDGSLGEAVCEVVSEQHMGFESDHGRAWKEERPSWEDGPNGLAVARRCPVP